MSSFRASGKRVIRRRPADPLWASLTTASVKSVQMTFLLTNVVIFSLQLSTLLLAWFSWRSTYVFMLYLPFFAAEWIWGAFAYFRVDHWLLDEFSGFSLGGRFYLCAMPSTGQRTYSKFMSFCFFLLWVYVLIWIREISVLMEAQSWDQVSSCTSGIFTAAEVAAGGGSAAYAYHPRGRFPVGGDDVYQSGTSYMFCPLDVRWGNDTGEVISGFEPGRNGLILTSATPVSTGGRVAIGAVAKAISPFPFPNPGIGAVGVLDNVTPSPLNSSFTQCPAATDGAGYHIDSGGQRHVVEHSGRKICSVCLARLRRDNGGAASNQDGLSHCPYDSTLGTDPFCVFCPGIFPSIFLEPEVVEIGALRAQAIWTGLVTFSPVLRELLMVYVGGYVWRHSDRKRRQYFLRNVLEWEEGKKSLVE